MLFKIYLFIFAFFRAALMAHGSSQARAQIGGTAASLCYSHSNQGRIQSAYETYTTAHSNTRSLTHWARPGIEPGLFLLCPKGNSYNYYFELRHSGSLEDYLKCWYCSFLSDPNALFSGIIGFKEWILKYVCLSQPFPRGNEMVGQIVTAVR